MVSKVKYPGRIEQDLHRKFNLQRIPQSEWFNLTDTQVELVKSYFREAEEALQIEKKKEADRRRELAQERARAAESKVETPAVERPQQSSREPQPYRYVPTQIQRQGAPATGESVSQASSKPVNHQPPRSSYSVPPGIDKSQSGEWSSSWVKTDPFSLAVSYLVLICPSLVIALILFAVAINVENQYSALLVIIGMGFLWLAFSWHGLIRHEMINRKRSGPPPARNVLPLTKDQIEQQRRRVFGKRR